MNMNNINNNITLTPCQKNHYIHLIKKSKYKFKINNDEKINNLIHNIIKNDNYIMYTKIKLLLLHFFKTKIVDKLLIKIKKQKLIKDIEILEYILSKKHEKKFKLYICNYWQYFYEIIKLNNNYLIKNKYIYLDFACGDGNKTIFFSKNFNINNNNIYGTDIKTWSKYDHKNHEFDFRFIIDNKLKYDDNYFDIITCFLALHHIKDIDIILQELNRILKDDGYIIVVEHNIIDYYNYLIVDIEHLIYEYIKNDNKEYINNPLYSKYYNWIEWDEIFKKNNFILCKKEMLSIDIYNEIRYDNIYYAIYKKVI